MTKKAKDSIDYQQPKALIFDLDGVITQTRKLHKDAWKNTFDRFFREKDPNQSSMTEKDYLSYIDGLPRYEGVEKFLASRKITLPQGKVNDQPDYTTISAVGNLKNQVFNDLLMTHGIETYPDAIEKLKLWKSKGYKTAIVSSSKNCKKIIETANIDHLFDTRVDGQVSEEMGLKGKPNPDIFTEAAKRLKVKPYEAVVFEDAESGVLAGQRGFFALVVGVNRFNNEKALRQNGADTVISTFEDLNLDDPYILGEFFSTQGEPIFPDNEAIFNALDGKKPAIFLDYDGTLSPIVPQPEDAVLSDSMKKTLSRLAAEYTVAIVTGRDKEDVENLVGLDELIYAGSHGYIISGPEGLSMEHPDSEAIIPRLDKVELEVKQLLHKKTEGTKLDRKRYAIGIHFRNARPEDEDTVKQIVDHILEKFPGHKKGEGKKILEIKPDTDWHKGKAVDWILKALELDTSDRVVPIFIGDDITDEDAFTTLKDKGIGILVGGHGQKTAAKYALKNVYQVGRFFEKLLEKA